MKKDVKSNMAAFDSNFILHNVFVFTFYKKVIYLEKTQKTSKTYRELQFI